MREEPVRGKVIAGEDGREKSGWRGSWAAIHYLVLCKTDYS
jgi:hypothetical protein